MKNGIRILLCLNLLPAISFAQALNWETGFANALDVVTCAHVEHQCVDTETSHSCNDVCTQYISNTNLFNTINAQSNRAANIEASVVAIRQDLKPSIEANTTELNNLKSSVSNAELQRLIQKFVREELNQRGL